MSVTNMTTFKTKRASFVNKHVVETAQVYEDTTQFLQQMTEDSVTEIIIFFYVESFHGIL